MIGFRASCRPLCHCWPRTIRPVYGLAHYGSVRIRRLVTYRTPPHAKWAIGERPLSCRLPPHHLNLDRDSDDGLSEAAAVEHSHECTNGFVKPVRDVLSLVD